MSKGLLDAIRMQTVLLPQHANTPHDTLLDLTMMILLPELLSMRLLMKSIVNNA